MSQLKHKTNWLQRFYYTIGILYIHHVEESYIGQRWSHRKLANCAEAPFE
jgi:hypothetical protein